MGTWNQISRFGFVRDRIGRSLAKGFVDRLRIQTPNLEQQVARLSGGNQQKVVVAKNLAIRPKVLLLDDPTVGIDVKSKADILDEARALAAEGNAIILVSSELGELSAVCDRVMVLQDGRITGWLDRSRSDDVSEAALTHAIQVA
jgi:ABC-type sugar transport system ATPase subunit